VANRIKTNVLPIQIKVKSTFGLTYWGNEWLNALNEIDHSNRLPRGRSYAKNGAVQNVTITKNRINATVYGSRPKPYKVTIKVPEFNAGQQKRLTSLFIESPSWLAGIYNKELDPALNEAAKKIKVPLFPDSWEDLEMSCSCPDFAIPCKHIAAVIYILAEQINLHPLLILELHNYDISRALKVTKVEKNEIEEENEKIEFIVDTKGKDIKETDPSFFGSVDYSEIDFIGDKLLNILPDHPPFQNAKFKSILIENFRLVISKTKTLIHSSENENLSNVHLADYAELNINSDFSNPEIHLHYGKKKEILDPNEWVEIAFQMPHAVLDSCHASIRLLREFAIFSQHLIQNGCFIPVIYSLQNDYKIFWQPLTGQSKIRDKIDRFEKQTPGRILNFTDSKTLNDKSGINIDKKALHILEIFINSFVNKTSFENVKLNYADQVQRFFFSGELLTGIKYKLLADNIRNWLKPLVMHQQRFSPVFKIDEKDNLYRLQLLIKDKQADRTFSFEEFRNNSQYEDLRFEMIRNFLRLKPYLPQIENILNQNEDAELRFDNVAFTDIFFNLLPVIQMLGLEILIPKELQKLIRPARKILVESKTGIKSFLDLNSMLNYKWQIAIGDELLDEKEFQKIVAGQNGIVKIRNQYVYISNEEIQKLLKDFTPSPAKGSLGLISSLLGEEMQGVSLVIPEILKKEIRKLTEIPSIALPQKIAAQLRPYQIRGYEWMYKNQSIGFGSILADDMGLGKTLQAICLLQKLKDEGKLKKKKALVVAPTSLLTNWSAEISRFAPDLNWFIYHGSARNTDDFSKAEIILTSYGTVRRDLEKLNKHPFQVILIDEAQNIKNPGTDQTKAIKKLTAPVRVALSGTPVENRLTEYWSIFDFVNKGLMGGLQYFKENFSTPIEISSNMERLEVFRKITSPFILRRMKSDKNIIQDLPDKTEYNRYCSLSKEQAALYENVVNEALKQIESSEGIERRGLVLKMMTSLKQICNHPANFLKEGKTNPKDSGKMELLLELIRETLEANEKMLVFTQYKEMGDLLVKFIEENLHIKTLFLHGSLTRNKRDEMVKQFQSMAQYSIFILSLKAGGTGLNLTAATNVVHYDLWWNPAVEAQATDRAYRIGQKKKVMVQRLICKGTLEEKIDLMIQSKKNLASKTVSTGEKWIGELSDNELGELVKLSKS
jgi:SNF2 family DNA or RNA helicase/uncharacterized Zn finger protein